MHCSNCKNTVHSTTKTCPNCGGNFDKLFGPNRKWGDPNHEHAPTTALENAIVTFVARFLAVIIVCLIVIIFFSLVT